MSRIEEKALSGFVRERVAAGAMHVDISRDLQSLYPGKRGLSSSSVRRFCASNNVSRRSGLDASEVLESVASAVAEVRVAPAVARHLHLSNHLSRRHVGWTDLRLFEIEGNQR